ncbi:MAG TPA: type I polyketide synthase, partial [Vicinamibacteria bacterium]
MSESPAPEALSAEKRALLALRRMRARLDEVERSRHEPIAVVGMACRFPGGALSPEAFWGLLRAGVDAITEVPRERWDLEAWYDPDPEAPGKTYARHGGFLAGVDQFDAAFFGLAPREAAAMDPQQRLLLEVAWEALEDAGQPADRLARSASGVFVGMTAGDYAQVLDRAGREAIEAYWITGNSPNFAAGRLSYLLGLQGPSLVVDTACSSSLVAVHLACQSLRTAESRLALAAGVNLTLVPDGTVALSKARMLAPGGRCRTFDAAADGYVRGEGCGVVVLKRLSDALADGDRIHALIRATAVNQDGRSSGLTVPNGLAQEAVLRQALAAAGVEPAEVGYVEAHGSGTALGDPIELRALGAVLGPGRAQGHPLLVGSVKTNIGHLEAAAGIAGLIKTVLAVRHGEVPPHLHFTTANPHVPWAELPIAVPTAARAWTGRRVAGVSSFGASGTNAHVIVEAPPAPAAAPPGAFPPERPLHLLTVSARTETALAALAGRYAERLAAADAPALADAAFTANAGRSHLAHRAAVVAATPDDARAQLRALSAGESGPAVLRGRAGAERPRVAFLFTGQGSQYTGMGQELYASEPAFRKALDECDERLRPHLDRTLLSVLYPPSGERSPLDDTTYTQPALFAVEWSLCQMWRSWGVEPAAVMGHSVGEYAAACVAGVLSVEDALKLLAARARLMGALPPGGAMWAVAASEAAVADALAVTGVPDVSVAAVNADDEVVLSGPDAALVAVAAAFQARGARARRLAVSHAFHSALMDPAREAFARVAADVRYAPPRLALVSNLSGDVAREEVADAAYWVRQLREPVRFAQGLKALRARGHAVFLEVGPHPTLCALGQKAEPDGPAAWLPTLRRGRGDWTQVLETLGRLYVEGADVDWAAFDGGRPRSRVTLPSYPFERQRHWVDGGSSARPRAAGGPVLHALLGSRVASPVEDALFAAEIGPRSWPALADHRIHDTVVMPATAFVEMAWAAAREVTGGDACALEDVVIAAPLAFADATERALQT